MDALDARFRDHTIGLFRKQGMFPVGFFHVAVPAGQAAERAQPEEALPVLGHAMYVPEIRCNGAEVRVSVTDP